MLGVHNSIKETVKEAIFHTLGECRNKTLALFEGMDEGNFRYQAHPDFSPIGWHLGHIAYTESLWLLEHSAGFPPLFPQYRKLFAANGLPKSKRVNLPSVEEVRYYLDNIRSRVLKYLEIADLEQQERLWRFLIQHESQHCETIAFIQHLIANQNFNDFTSTLSGYQPNLKNINDVDTLISSEAIKIPAGEFERGCDRLDYLDNEAPANNVYIETYYIDKYPVICGHYRQFMEAGGYQNSQWWSEEAWEWLQTEEVTKPLYWQDDSMWDNHPVCGVSYYEAAAYAKFVGKRLPTEAEWEKAARWDAKAKHSRIYPWGDRIPTKQDCNYDNLNGKTTPVQAYPSGQSAYGLYDTLGNVWEWTATWFHAYEGFENYPYVGYSTTYFDQKHRVLKGGSWATRPWVLRCSFRNWYHPGVRQILAGFRCAKSDNSD
ncbi:MAG: ergothioneine biosynthesis protein EgtB [Calothrix sp. MO_167.B42]|nr:ergothioneine biosynthesis protein EgtB [Calothrix sp. MO_167.B42]